MWQKAFGQKNETCKCIKIRAENSRSRKNFAIFLLPSPV